VSWYLFENLNPEPWRSPEASIGRKGGKYVPRLYKPETVRAYQEALGEEFDRLYPGTEPVSHPVSLELYFWRQVDTHDGEQRRHGNYADATNLQKSTEDVLQGRLFVNDRQVVQVRSTICGQGAAVHSRILIGVGNPKPISDHLHLVIQQTRDSLVRVSQLESRSSSQNIRKFDVKDVF
jgi:Holliday junction resolvase RusA-like endonuclease